MAISMLVSVSSMWGSQFYQSCSFYPICPSPPYLFQPLPPHPLCPLYQGFQTSQRLSPLATHQRHLLKSSQMWPGILQHVMLSWLKQSSQQKFNLNLISRSLPNPWKRLWPLDRRSSWPLQRDLKGGAKLGKDCNDQQQGSSTFLHCSSHFPFGGIIFRGALLSFLFRSRQKSSHIR